MIRHLRKETARLLRGFARRLEPHTLQLEHGHAGTDPFFDCVERLGFKPRHIVDIGANRGNWTRTALRYFPDARYTLFEPQGELLKGFDLYPRIQIFAMGAGPKTSTMKLSKHERDDSFSFALSEQEVAIRVESRLRFLLSHLASF